MPNKNQQLEYPFEGVHGLMSNGDRAALRQLSQACAAVDGCYVEIGCLTGLSTLCILSAMPETKTLHVYDFFEPAKLKAFDQNMAAAGFAQRVKKIPGNFRAHLAHNEPVAFAFVDHDHLYESTKTAFDWLWPRLQPNGILAFHDYGHPDYPGGTQFMKEIKHKPLPMFANSGILAFQLVHERKDQEQSHYEGWV